MIKRITLLVILIAVVLTAKAQFGSYSHDLPFMGMDSSVTTYPNPTNYAGLMFWLDAYQGTNRIYDSDTNSYVEIRGGYSGSYITNNEPVWNVRNQHPKAVVSSFDIHNRDALYTSLNVSTPSAHYWQSSGGPNGGPAFYHTNSSTEALRIHSGGGGATNTPIYMFWVVKKFTSATNVQEFLICSDASIGGSDYQIYWYNDGKFHLWGGGSYINAPQPYTLTNDWTILTLCYNGSSSFIRTNGVLLAQGTTGTTVFDGGQMLCAGASETLDWVGGWSEIVGFGNVTLSTNDIANLERYLGQRWGISVP